MPPKIAVCITEHNRPEVFAECIEKQTKHLPKDAVLIVVDDASTEPVKNATYRFEQNAGIARAKNKCLELAEAAGAEHIFLFDSDCYPIQDGWEKPYLESQEPHLMYIFKDFVGGGLNDCKELYRDSKLVAYSHPRGCMLYFDKSILGQVGGMDVRYGRWGNEHVDLSNRIYNKGLTSFRYADVVDSNKLIRSLDEQQKVPGTVGRQERQELLAKSKALVEESKTAEHYCEYRDIKPKARDIKTETNLFLTSYLIGQPDAQRSGSWEPDLAGVKPLYESAKALGIKTVLLTDVPQEFPDKEKVECAFNPYFSRWLLFYQYLRDNPSIDNVFLLDSTDVIVQNDPFPHVEKDKLYVGDEETILANRWIINTYRTSPVMPFIRRNPSKKLLNCGIVGGDKELVMGLCHDIIRYYFDTAMVDRLEMGIFNKLCYTKYLDRIVHGPQVNTVFKRFQTDNPTPWFKHK
jgi:glycosyltransferase involved in cell wall biosynthesis